MDAKELLMAALEDFAHVRSFILSPTTPDGKIDHLASRYATYRLGVASANLGAALRLLETRKEVEQ